MAYQIEFYTQFVIKINNANFSDPTVASTMKSDTTITVFSIFSASRLANGIAVYLSPVLEYLTMTFYTAAKSFFTLVEQIEYSLSFGFMCLYAVVYLAIFISFIQVLNVEIRQSREIVTMIPPFVLESNKRVQEQVRSR